MGFYTNSKTRPLVLDKLEEAIEDESIHCHSRKVQVEMLRFIIDDNGDMHAMDGYHDDTVMAAAIGLYCIPWALRAGRMTADEGRIRSHRNVALKWPHDLQRFSVDSGIGSGQSRER